MSNKSREYFNHYYSSEELGILKAVLTNRDYQILKMVYGEDLSEKLHFPETNKAYYHAALSGIFQKINNYLKEDHSLESELSKYEYFNELKSIFDKKELIIFAYFFGYIGYKSYNVEEIAYLLNMSIDEVRKILEMVVDKYTAYNAEQLKTNDKIIGR